MNTIELLDKKPFHHTHIGVGNLPSAYLDSLSYYEQLAFLTEYIVNTVIPKVNENITISNQLVTEFNEVKELVDKAEEDVAELTQKVLDLTAQLARILSDAKDYTDAEVDALTTYLEHLLSTRISTLDNKYAREVERLDDKIEHFPIANTIVQNSIRGEETTIQTYLDDITNLLRRGGITAGEYDALELTASEYDVKEITAYRYDFFGNLELTGSSEVDSIVLYNQTGQNTDGAMTQKAVTDALNDAGIEFSDSHTFAFINTGISAYNGSGVITVNESNNLVQLRGGFRYRDMTSLGSYTLPLIPNTSWYGLYIGTLNYKPETTKICYYCYHYANATNGLNILTLCVTLLPYYLPLIIDTQGNVYLFAQEEEMSIPELTVSSSGEDFLYFDSIIIDVKNLTDLV